MWGTHQLWNYYNSLPAYDIPYAPAKPKPKKQPESSLPIFMGVDIEATSHELKINKMLEITVVPNNRNFVELARLTAVIHFDEKEELAKLHEQERKRLETLMKLQKMEQMELALANGEGAEKLMEIMTQEQKVQTSSTIISPLDDFSRRTHTANGLLEECKKSTNTLEQVETQIIQLITNVFLKLQIYEAFVADDLKDLNPEFVSNNLCLFGSSVAFDKQIIERDMPKLAKLIHFRVEDVSSIWVPSALFGNAQVLHGKPKKKTAKNHRSEEDIDSSLNLMRFYIHTLWGKTDTTYSP